MKVGDLIRYVGLFEPKYLSHGNPLGIVVDVSYPHGLDVPPWITVSWSNKLSGPMSAQGFAVVSSHEDR